MVEFWGYLVFFLCYGIVQSLRCYVFRLNALPVWPILLPVVLRLAYGVIKPAV